MKPFTDLAIKFDGDDLFLLDQRRLPDHEEWIRIPDPSTMVDCIKELAVRGAPLIGVAAASALALYRVRGASEEETRNAEKALRASRPTAVNLMWALDKMLATDSELAPELLSQCADQIIQDEIDRCEKMGNNGAALVEKGEGILTHCNTGGLATVGIGTALGVIRRAHENGKDIHVFVDETRPLLQGGRLTTWELEKLEIPYTLICDNMAAAAMAAGKIQRVFLGSDRVAVNGDFANKIGTYSVAVNAKYHGVKFHPVAPLSTVDFSCATGKEIPIEIRTEEEVRGVVSPQALRWAPEKAQTWNPSFDVTPASLVTSLVLDSGVYSSAELAAGALKELHN